MIICSDWHIHSEASYDASLPLQTISDTSREFGFRRVGITDHANFNDTKYLADLQNSARIVTEFQKKDPRMVLGVELTPIELPLFQHIQKTGVRDGYVPPIQSTPYDMELAQTKEQLMALGVRYAIGAAHWRVDVPNRKLLPPDLEPNIREWHRQQMWLACDERVTILGHPWSCNLLWYGDFTIIPASLHDEFAAALKENGKYAECNCSMFTGSDTSEYFRNQYAEYMRYLFEKGIPITIGTDCHGSSARNDYPDRRAIYETYLSKVGFREGDFTDLPDSALWQL